MVLGAEAIAAAGRGEWGNVLTVQGGRVVPADHPLVRTAQAIGISLGD